MSSDRADIEAVLADEIGPALSAHAGGIELVAVEERQAQLRLRGSCGACYFRRGCIEHLALPALEERLGDRFEYRFS